MLDISLAIMNNLYVICERQGEAIRQTAASDLTGTNPALFTLTLGDIFRKNLNLAKGKFVV